MAATDVDPSKNAVGYILRRTAIVTNNMDDKLINQRFPVHPCHITYNKYIYIYIYTYIYIYIHIVYYIYIYISLHHKYIYIYIIQHKICIYIYMYTLYIIPSIQTLFKQPMVVPLAPREFHHVGFSPRARRQGGAVPSQLLPSWAWNVLISPFLMGESPFLTNITMENHHF